MTHDPTERMRAQPANSLNRRHTNTLCMCIYRLRLPRTCGVRNGIIQHARLAQ